LGWVFVRIFQMPDADIGYFEAFEVPVRYKDLPSFSVADSD